MFQKTFRDIAELSQTSGLSISTIRRLVRDHRIPFLQPSGKGGKLLFPVDALGETSTVTSLRPTAARRLAGRQPLWMEDQT